MLVIICVQGSVKDLIICYVQESDKGCWLSVVPKRVINGGCYQLCPRG